MLKNEQQYAIIQIGYFEKKPITSMTLILLSKSLHS